ncbi:hypothetical protein [Anaerotruncus massiliensis (ex Liu et al. 2021)]|uniref:hypothetical protein n=1 Tax=Anaerotruncus massiliensis (ex Liu et al. 2021) TaxID=2321404 RepID=UPI003AF5FAF3
MLLTVDTSLGDAILARYGGFVYSISDGAQMLLLQHPDAQRMREHLQNDYGPYLSELTAPQP